MVLRRIDPHLGKFIYYILNNHNDDNNNNDNAQTRIFDPPSRLNSYFKALKITQFGPFSFKNDLRCSQTFHFLQVKQHYATQVTSQH